MSICDNLIYQSLISKVSNPRLNILLFECNGKVISVATVYSPLSNSFRITGGPIQKNREQIFENLTKN